MKIMTYPIIACLILVYFCSCQKEIPDSFINSIAEIKSTWAPDKRTTVFDVEAKHKEGKWQIEGETSVPEAYHAVNQLINKTFSDEDANINFNLLPPAEFEDTTHALVNVSVGNLRSRPSHRAEMVDQVLMGMELKLLKTKSYWYLVQTPSGYLGWTTRGTLERVGDTDLSEWHSSEKLTVNTNFAQVFTDKSIKSQVISDLVLGVSVKKISDQGSWTEIELPDGRVGFVRSSKTDPYQEQDESIVPDRKRIIALAKTMMGIPYLWGGHSTKGFDCSGFTSTIFRMEGMQLPRDASMQVNLGEEVIPDSNYSNVLAGDLIFFGSPNRITHVGICLGGSYFIHASGNVHINSLDENDELFNSYRKRTFRHIKRLIKN